MPTIPYSAPLQILVAVKGHPFDRNAIAALFEDMNGIGVTFVDQPAAAQLMNPEAMAKYDALVLYDMPGMDFDAPDNKPGFVEPDESFKTGFEALLAQGKGIVALHHSLSGWPVWPRYREIFGGCFLYRPREVRGQVRLDSGYRHEVEYDAQVVAPEHPVMAGIPASFPMKDELYLAEIYESEVTPLLRSSHSFTRDNFYSATAAMEGRMFDNEGWDHEDGSNLIGWAKKEGRSQIVYLQPGDDHITYDNPIYRRMVKNAIRWVVNESR